MNKLLQKLPFYNQRWFQFVRFLTRHFLEDDCQQKAASLTYTTMLSIVPIFTVLLMILSTVPALASVRAQIYSVIYSNLVPQSSVQVSQYINDFAEKSANLTAIGVMVLFVTTIMTLTTIEKAFNQIWRIEDRSGGFKSIIRYWTIVTLGPLVLGTAFIVSSTVQSLSFLNREVAGYGIDWSFWVQAATMIVTMTGFIGMYWFIPKARVPIKNAAFAGIFVTIIFELLKHTFGVVMSNFTSYEAIYGAFAALPIFLLWIYLSWNLILLGVEISYTLTIFETKEVYPRHPLFSLLDMLNLVYRHHQVGDSVTEQQLRDVLGRKELPKWYTYLNYLQDSDLVAVTEHDNYVLKKDLSHMSLWDFYRTLPYPLPIKDELDEMNQSQMQPWLSSLIEHFVQTESYAKNQLNIPLSDIFAHSGPRKKTTSSHDPSDSSTSEECEETNNVEAFDPKADIVTDNHDHEILLPDDLNSSDNHKNSKDCDDISKSNLALEKKQPRNKILKKPLLASVVGTNIITEADNPDRAPKQED